MPLSVDFYCFNQCQYLNMIVCLRNKVKQVLNYTIQVTICPFFKSQGKYTFELFN